MDCKIMIAESVHHSACTHTCTLFLEVFEHFGRLKKKENLVNGVYTHKSMFNNSPSKKENRIHTCKTPVQQTLSTAKNSSTTNQQIISFRSFFLYQKEKFQPPYKKCSFVNKFLASVLVLRILTVSHLNVCIFQQLFAFSHSICSFVLLIF